MAGSVELASNSFERIDAYVDFSCLVLVVLVRVDDGNIFSWVAAILVLICHVLPELEVLVLTH